jgi:hypothetical protein
MGTMEGEQFDAKETNKYTRQLHSPVQTYKVEV